MRTTRFKAEHKPKLTASQFASKVVKKAITRTREIGTSRKSSRKLNKCLGCGKDFISKWKLMDHHCVKSKFRAKQTNTNLEASTSNKKLRQTAQIQKLRIEEILKCNICGESFNNAACLKTHLAGHTVHSENKKYICNVCKQTFETSDEWKEHIQQSANASHCDQCGQNFGCVTAKMRHMCIVPTSFECLECKASFKKKWVLERHTLYQHTYFQCIVCKKKFRSRSLYEEHILTHKQANLSNLKSKDRDLGAKHLGSEAERKTRSSSESQKQTKTVTSINGDELPTKLSKVGDQEDATFPKLSLVSNKHKSRTCKYCHKLFRSFKQLKLHTRFKCSIASQFLRPTTPHAEQKANAIQSVETLTSVFTKSYKCGSCPKMYRSEKQLQLHKKVHEVVNLQLGCKKCGRQFWSKSHFADHMQLHERKQLKCETCSIGTSTLIQYRIHRASHFAKLHVSAKKEFKGSAAKTAYDCNHCHKRYLSLKDFEDHCSMMNLYAVSSKVNKYNGKHNKNCDLSSVEESLEMSDCGATVMEPTEAAGLPEEAKECRDVKSNTVKITEEIHDAHNLAKKKTEDYIVASVNVSNPLLKEPNQLDSIISQDVILQEKMLNAEKEENSASGILPNGCNASKIEKKDVTVHQSKFPDTCTINRSAIDATDSATSSFVVNANSLSTVAKHNFKAVVNATRKSSDPLNDATGDTDHTCESITSDCLIQNSVAKLQSLKAKKPEVVCSSRKRVDNHVPIPEKQCKYSPVAKTLVAVFVRQLLQEGISETSPHVCGYCGRVFLKPQGINNHYLMKHTLQEIENLPTSSVNHFKKDKIEDVVPAKVMKINKVSASLKTNEMNCSPFTGSSMTNQDDIMDSENSKEVKEKETLENIPEKQLHPQVSSLKKQIAVGFDSKGFDKNYEQISALSELRLNFSKLFCHLVGDKEVLSDLGWPQRQIDEVLTDVITRCDLKPSNENCELTSLRENISILLEICIKEQAMNSFGWNVKLVDIVVKEMLAGGDIATGNLEAI